jgi:hypothetical protein
MGYDPTLGYWSVGSAHHEHTLCDPACHHVIDSWDRAEADVESGFLGGQSTVSMANYTLRPFGFFQGISDDGNATQIQLKAPTPRYPLVFNEKGLSNQTSWSVTVNGTTVSSQKPDIVIEEVNGTYLFTVSPVPGFVESPSSGSLSINGQGATENIQFRILFSNFSVMTNSNGHPVLISFNGNVSVAVSTLDLSTGSSTSVRFSTTEKGASGILNVTIPKSVVPSNSMAQVFIDGVRDNNIQTVTDPSNYFLSFSVAYGNHSVDLEFSPQENSYVAYLIAGGIAGSILGALSLTYKVKRRKPKVSNSKVEKEA